LPLIFLWKVKMISIWHWKCRTWLRTRTKMWHK